MFDAKENISEKDRLIDLGHVPGNIYLIKDEKASWGVMKLLAVDEGGVHVRVYANQFKYKPEHVNLSELTLGNASGEKFGIGHMPLSYETVYSWGPEYIAFEPVTEEDLVGYRLWEKDGKSYF